MLKSKEQTDAARKELQYKRADVFTVQEPRLEKCVNLLWVHKLSDAFDALKAGPLPPKHSTYPNKVSGNSGDGWRNVET